MKEWFLHLHREALPIWISGGWAMIALVINALVIFGLGLHLLAGLAVKGAFARPQRAWEKWSRKGARARGPLSRVIVGAMRCPDFDSLHAYFTSLHTAEFRPFTRDLAVLRVAVSAAPLLGLLGTVTGMLTTFRGLSTGAGGEKTMGVIARGISEALITTETGLVLALTGLAFQFALSRAHDRLDKTMAHIETQCAQRFHRQTQEGRIAA